jgi:hypothetical protein
LFQSARTTSSNLRDLVKSEAPVTEKTSPGGRIGNQIRPRFGSGALDQSCNGFVGAAHQFLFDDAIPHRDVVC